MKRRVVLSVAIAIPVILTAPCAIAADRQETPSTSTRKVPLVGDPGVPDISLPGLVALRQGLRDRGYIEGQTIAVEYRWGGGKLQTLPALAAELKLTVVEVWGRDYERAFRTITADRAEALFVGANAQFYIDRKRIIELAARYRLPAIYEWPEQAEDGGLMGYGTSLAGLSRRAATYIAHIFEGAKPADLPIEQPTKFELIINLKTAKALGLTIPQSLLLRADQVIQ